MLVAHSTQELASLLSPLRTAGQVEGAISGIASLREAVAGDLSFLGNPKYKGEVPTTKASVVLVPPDYEGQPGSGQLYFWVENPSVALARVCARLEQKLWPRPQAAIHPSASVAADARVAPTATVGPLCVIESGACVEAGAHLQASVFIGRNAVVGPDCWLQPGVVVSSHCRLGKRVRLQPGVIVGSDGFGYEFVNGRHEKVPQIGIVEIGDDVEIGANTTLDRARFSRTLIGAGTKIDNLVQIGHNVVIGQHCILCAQVGIAGSTTLEDYVVLGGQVGVSGHIRVARGTKVGGQAGIIADTDAGTSLSGMPAIPIMLERRLHILKTRLPELFRRVEALEKGNAG